MPNLKEAAVAVAGQIIDVEQLIDFETKKRDGSLKVVIATGDGFAQVKIAPEDADTARPVPNSHIAWFVRYGAWAREGSGNASATCRFIGLATEEFVGRVNGIIKSTAPKPAA